MALIGAMFRAGGRPLVHGHRCTLRPVFFRLTAGQLKQAIELFNRHAFERAEVRSRQRGVLKVAQQAGAVEALLALELVPRNLVLTAAGQLGDGRIAVLGREFSSRRAIEVKALARLAERHEVTCAASVTTQERRKRLLGEHAGRPLLNVSLNAQLQWLGAVAEQAWKALSELRGRLGRRRFRWLGGKRRHWLVSAWFA